VLASLLPGLRDLRAPLAAGYLWLAAGWLYFAPRLPTSANDADGVVRDIYRVVDASGPVAVGAGVTFLAYMLGILSTGIFKSENLREIAIMPVIGTLTILYYLIKCPLGKRIRSHRPSVLDDLDESILKYDEIFIQATIHRTEDVVVRKLTDRAMTDREYRDALVQESDPEAEGYIEGLRTVFHIHTGPPSNPIEENALLERIRAHIKEIGLQTFISTAASRHERLLIEALVWSVGEVRRRISEIVDELRVVPARIVVDNAATYERWDRLNAEAEFREAVVPPCSQSSQH
jgi:hypothetical protein